MKTTMAAAILCLLGAAGIAQAQDPDLARNLAATCANCHGTNGHSAGGMDSLAGEAPDRMMRKLMEFRSGERPATIMHQIAKGYTEDQLRLIAEFFAKQ